MELLSAIPALIRVGFAFCAVLLAIRKNMGLGNSFLVGAALLGLLFSMPPHLMAGSAAQAVVSPGTLCLAVIVGLILVLSSCMEQTGQMQRMLDAFRGLVASPLLNLVVFPALIGLLPMPGGAVFSAPMVRQLGERLDISAARLSFTNYWFRHIWEYWWPLYPGILLATALADVNLAVLVPVMAPLTLASIALGCMVVHRAAVGKTGRPAVSRSLKPFGIEIMPILLVIIPGLGAGLLLSRWFPELSVAKELGLIAALFAAIFRVFQANRMKLAHLARISANRDMLRMVYMIFAILVFKELLEASGAVSLISRELIYLNIPVFVITIALPFLVGMITGITVAFVGSTFPILIPLVQSVEPGAALIPYVMLAMACGFAGVLISPLHLCLILSNQYFQSPMKPVYRLLFLPSTGLVVLSCLYFIVMRSFFPN
jgi:hypothetical protein